jgi:hypothetical protein
MYFDSTIKDYELENYFYDMLPVSHAIGDRRRKKLASMTDEERTARRKKFQTILKIGVAVGAVTTLVIFSAQIMAALAPVFPAMKSALAKKGINTKGLKVGEVAEKFSTEVAGKAIPTDTDKTKRGLQLAKNILGWFASAKKRRDEGTATELEKALLTETDKVTDKISKLSESDAAKTLQNILTEGTADEGNSIAKGEPVGTKEGSESASGMDIKKYIPIALVVLGVLFFMKRG